MAKGEEGSTECAARWECKAELLRGVSVSRAGGAEDPQRFWGAAGPEWRRGTVECLAGRRGTVVCLAMGKRLPEHPGAGGGGKKPASPWVKAGKWFVQSGQGTQIPHYPKQSEKPVLQKLFPSSILRCSLFSFSMSSLLIPLIFLSVLFFQG